MSYSYIYYSSGGCPTQEWWPGATCSNSNSAMVYDSSSNYIKDSTNERNWSNDFFVTFDWYSHIHRYLLSWGNSQFYYVNQYHDINDFKLTIYRSSGGWTSAQTKTISDPSDTIRLYLIAMYVDDDNGYIIYSQGTTSTYGTEIKAWKFWDGSTYDDHGNYTSSSITPSYPGFVGSIVSGIIFFMVPTAGGKCRRMQFDTSTNSFSFVGNELSYDLDGGTSHYYNPRLYYRPHSGDSISQIGGFSDSNAVRITKSIQGYFNEKDFGKFMYGLPTTFSTWDFRIAICDEGATKTTVGSALRGYFVSGQSNFYKLNKVSETDHFLNPRFFGRKVVSSSSGKLELYYKSDDLISAVIKDQYTAYVRLKNYNNDFSVNQFLMLKDKYYNLIFIGVIKNIAREDPCDIELESLYSIISKKRISVSYSNKNSQEILNDIFENYLNLNSGTVHTGKTGQTISYNNRTIESIIEHQCVEANGVFTMSDVETFNFYTTFPNSGITISSTSNNWRKIKVIDRLQKYECVKIYGGYVGNERLIGIAGLIQESDDSINTFVDSYPEITDQNILDDLAETIYNNQTELIELDIELYGVGYIKKGYYVTINLPDAPYYIPNQSYYVIDSSYDLMDDVCHLHLLSNITPAIQKRESAGTISAEIESLAKGLAYGEWHMTAKQSISSGVSTQLWQYWTDDSDEYDMRGGSGSDVKFYLPHGGKYIISMIGRFDYTSGGTYKILFSRLYHSNGTYDLQPLFGTPDDVHWHTYTALVTAVDGDYFRVYAKQNSGSTLGYEVQSMIIQEVL